MNLEGMKLEQFLERNNINEGDWKNSKIEWDELKAIGLKHFSKIGQLKETAELFAKIIQQYPKVHSVRWRVKDPEHLMEKIVRKRIEGSDSYNPAYLDINHLNYHEIVTDLIGVRALHLFKDDCFDIDEYLRDTWNTKEIPVYYERDGDELEIDKERFNVKPHPAGYRSIHYVFVSQPLNQNVYTEVQVRTIFEEGWSEVDHKVRYPNFSDNAQVSYFLRIFNRLAGSADEMGSFVKDLVSGLEETEKELEHFRRENEKIKQENDKNINEIDRLFMELDSSKGKNARQNRLVNDLKNQVDKLKSQSHKSPVFFSSDNSDSSTKTTQKTIDFIKYLESITDDAAKKIALDRANKKLKKI